MNLMKRPFITSQPNWKHEVSQGVSHMFSNNQQRWGRWKNRIVWPSGWSFNVTMWIWDFLKWLHCGDLEWFPHKRLFGTIEWYFVNKRSSISWCLHLAFEWHFLEVWGLRLGGGPNKCWNKNSLPLCIEPLCYTFPILGYILHRCIMPPFLTHHSLMLPVWSSL